MEFSKEIKRLAILVAITVATGLRILWIRQSPDTNIANQNLTWHYPVMITAAILFVIYFIITVSRLKEYYE